MWFRTRFDSLKTRPARRPAVCRLRLEPLDDRIVPSFSPAVNYPVATASPVVTADFNGDGRLDLAVANTNSVSVLLGNGDGTFQPAITSPTTGAGGAMVAADFDGNGKIDLVTTSYGMAVIFLGNGDGTFQAPSPLPGSGGTDFSFLAVAVGDVNGNGTADLVLTGNMPTGSPDDPSAQGFFDVLLGNGDGTFVQGGGDWVGAEPSSIALADLNGDGHLDLVIGDSSTQFVYVIPGHGDGAFYYQTGYGVGTLLYGVGVADFNHDGKPDLAIPVEFGGGYSLEIFSGNGDGTFAYGGNFPSGGVSNPTIADFNRDGNLDVATTSPGSVSVVLGNGDGTFAPPLGVATDDPYPSGLVAGDFNGDGFPDLAVNAGYNAVSVLLNDGDWYLPPPPPPPAPSIAINDRSVIEGNTGTQAMTFTVSLSAAYGQTVTVGYSTADGTATAGSDYQAISGTLTFAPGETSQTIMVQVIGDRLPEANETFLVNLSDPTNASVADGQGIGTIVDDEPRISISDVTLKEGNGKKTTLFTFTVTLSAAYDQPVTMSYRTVDGTAKTSDNDYVAKSGTLTFAPGETTKTIAIEVKGDSKRETNETFYLDLLGNSSNSLLVDGRGVGTIVNDD
jgi:hypothetical protein